MGDTVTAFITIGHITDAHGIRGAVKIKSLAANPADIASYGPLQTDAGGTVEILRMKPARDEFIADLKGIDDRNKAEALKGTALLLPRERLPVLPDGEYYLLDLVGKSARAAGTVLGPVIGIQNYGAGDLLEIDTGTKNTLLVPLIFITATAPDVELDLPDGYLADEKPPQPEQNQKKPKPESP
jgi:16S rRNA processing protein RimM